MRSTPRNLLLFIAAFVIATTGTILYVREPLVPLTEVALKSARARWQREGIKDYRVEYTMNSDPYVVSVRDGIVMDATVNGRPVRAAELNTYSIDGLFRLLEMELENIRDVENRFPDGGSTTLARVRFHPELGYVERYLRTGGGMGRGASITLTRIVPDR